MTGAEERSGLSRRDMLRRSAVAGGTLLWVTPVVSVLSASPAFASEVAQGDGSRMDASYYLLAFNCGGTYYLVKVGSTEQGDSHPFTLDWGPGLKGSAKDPNDGWPATGGETQGINRRHVYALHSAGLPPDVKFYVVQGQLYVDLDQSNDGHPCTLDYWIAHNGQLYFKKSTPAGPYDPQQVDPGDPTVLAFPLLPNK